MKNFIINTIAKALLLILVFYLIYPQALEIRGSSFISMSGIVGIILYGLHKFPFKEVVSVLIVFGILIFICYISAYVNGFVDDFMTGYIRSQMGWFFTAYMIIYFMYRIHGNPTIYTVLGYIIAAIALQSVITLIMFFNEAANDFFFSLQLKSIVDEETKEIAEKERLIGYGIGFFGAGIVAGYALIFIMYLFLKIKMNIKTFIFLALLYAFIFYVGLFSARTTVIGFTASFVVFAILFFIDVKPQRRQGINFIGILLLLLVVGYALCYIYFPDFTEWAFELFDRFRKEGRIETASSNGIIGMLYAPNDFKTFIIGNGNMAFFGSDVGYTRLMFYIGVPGMIMYFFYSAYVGIKCFTKDWTLNFLIIALLIYNMIMNVKGFTDLNMILYLFFFYFLFYKYYVFLPKVYSNQRREISKKDPISQI
ncbi:hypothetical protein [Dysgonomonas sp. ZJ279]|uniref:hypothetical protein n=1 Tax=Dysgonomonas sp. ZJ279 TaxID=2709796 RepID=UPI0013EAD4BF|nr:hypothetical protein [Dysgonomonas sp. ZJ279]